MAAGVKAGTAYVEVEPDLTRFNKKLGDDKTFKRVGRRIGSGLAVGIGVGLAGVAVGAKKSIDAASDLDESLNKTTATFEKSSPKIKRWSKQTADSLGLMRSEALEAAGSVGAMLKPMGVAPRQAANMSKRMVQLAGDMASFNNEDPTEMLDRIRAGLSGESEPLKRFGTVLSETRVKQHAWKTGIAESGEELTETQKIMGRYSLLLKDTSDQQGDFERTSDGLANVQRRLRANIGDVSTSIGQALLPAYRDVARAANEFAGDVSKIAARKDLDVGEKLKLGMESAEEAFGPLVQRIGRKLEEADIAGKVGDAIAFLAPRIADAMAAAAPRAARAFVEGFMGAGVWGRLLIAGFLMKKLGGLRAFTAVGAAGGGAMGAGMATGVASSGLKGRLVGLMKSIGPAAGIALGVAILPDLVKKLKEGGIEGNISTKGAAGGKGDIANVRKQVDEIDKLGLTAGETQKRLTKMADYYRDLAKLPDATREQRKHFNDLADSIDRTSKPAKDAQATFRSVRATIERMATGSSDSVRSLRTNVRLSTRQIKKSLGDDTKEGKDALVKNFRAAAANIRTSMHHGEISTKEGTAEIERLMVKALQSMGFSKKQAVSLRNRAPGSKQTPSAGGELRPNQRGSYIDEGAPSGDSVPSLLERGEYVLNRNAVKKVGRRALDRLNFSAAPRFQQGGIVELLHPFNDPEGHGGDNSHLHVAHASTRAIVALGKRLQKLGWLVGEHPAFGGIQGRHAPSGYHYTGQAIDVNWPNAGQEGAKIRALLPLLGGKLGSLGAVEKLKRVLVGGPDSPLKSIVQGALDTTLAAAQSNVDAAGSGFEGTEVGANFSGSWVDLMGSISKQRGWNLGDWKELVQRESGGNPNARNPTSGAYGLGQFLGATAQAYAKHGALSSDPVDQIRAMAMYISDRYGNPSSALSFHDRNNWYSQGGMVGMQTGGGVTGRKGVRKLIGDLMGGRLGGALNIVKVGKTKKIRNDAIGRLLDRVKGIGLPAEMTRNLRDLSTNSNLFGEYADRAGQLTDTDAITSALEAEMTKRGGNFPGAEQDRLVYGMLGRVGGKTQQEWLEQQLGQLLGWRNTIIQAEQVVVEKREQVAKMIERARERLKAVREQIRTATQQRKGLAKRLKGVQKRLEKLREKPKRNKGRIKALRGQQKLLRGRIATVDERLGVRGRLRDALKDKILPALTGQRSSLNTARGDLLSNLETVQGMGSRTDVLASLPPMGELGGTIFDVQSRLRELTSKPIRVEAETTGEPEKDTVGSEALAELLRQANLRTAVSERQFDVFKDMPPFGGSFKDGGVVPGPAGAPRMILAHGGETVVPEGPAGRVRVVVEDHRTRVFVDDVEQIVERKIRREARSGARVMPGRTGGGIRG